MSSSQIAENYQLKWHSHLTNLNSSVATLFRNDKFADVLLFPSQMDGGYGIPAHKIILSSCSHFFAQVFDTNPSPPNSLVYIVLPPEISRRSMICLIQYMYSGEATVSNDILNEVLHGGELLKIRGLCRNKQQTHSSSMAESSSLHYATAPETGCEKTIYDQHTTDRFGGSAIIKESPVIVTSPQHLGNAAVTAHKPSSSSSSSSSSSTTIACPSMCPNEQEISKRNSINYGLKSSVVRNHCSYNSPTQNMHIKSSVVHGGDMVGHMPPPVSQITSSTQSSSSLIHSPDSHSNSSTNPNGMGIKKESAMTINAMNDDLISVPASHYGLVSLQIAAAVKKAQQITEKRCGGGTQSSTGAAHLYQKAHISNTIVNNHNESQNAAAELLGKHIENGNNIVTASATITTTSTNNNFVRRYSDDYYTKDDLPSGSHILHQQQSDYSRKSDKEQQPQSQPPQQQLQSLPQQPQPPQPQQQQLIQKQSLTNSTDNFEKIPSPMMQKQVTQMSQNLQMSIKQEPVEWSDFEHESSNLNKSSIEVAVKPELIYSKGDTDEEATEQQEQQEPIYSPLSCELCPNETFTVPADWVRHIESHSEATHCVPKKRKHIESSSLSENIAALRCDLCETYFAPAEWVRHVQNHTETELALSNNNASLRRSSVNNSTSHRSSRPQTQHIEGTKYGHPQSNSHR